MRISFHILQEKKSHQHGPADEITVMGQTSLNAVDTSYSVLECPKIPLCLPV